MAGFTAVAAAACGGFARRAMLIIVIRRATPPGRTLRGMAGPRRRAASNATGTGGAAERAAPKDEFVLVRLTGADRDRLRRTAARDYLEMSTWARRAILQALDRAEAEGAAPAAGAADDVRDSQDVGDAPTTRAGTGEGSRRRGKRDLPDVPG